MQESAPGPIASLVAVKPIRHRDVYIAKPDGRQRPLAIAALEDKIVQQATVAVLGAR